MEVPTRGKGRDNEQKRRDERVRSEAIGKEQTREHSIHTASPIITVDPSADQQMRSSYDFDLAIMS